MRKLMSIREIKSLSPIPKADIIETAQVDGWEVVVKKGLHQVGDKVVYLEIDSFLPISEEVFADFCARSTKKAVNPDGEKVEGHVLKTIKLRGQISQGAIIPLRDFKDLDSNSTQDDVDQWMTKHGVFKYEPPAMRENPSIVASFPAQYAQRTDSQRVQNLDDDFLASLNPDKWYATEKVDGTSATFFKDEEGKLRAASRNWEVSLDDDSKGNVYSIIANQYHLGDILSPGDVIQGEIVGESIQGNRLKLSGLHLYVFSTSGIKPGSAAEDFVKSHQVPKVELSFPHTVEEAVQQVDGFKSLITPGVNAEGVVWWNCEGEVFEELDNRANFKAINNKFLLKYAD